MFLENVFLLPNFFNMDYQETLNYMFNSLPMFQRVGGAAYKADLDNTLRLCELLDNPEKEFKSIHIAGTNGKGSTSHIVASVLQEAGFKTGLYTSPHLKDFRERIRINGEMISEDYVVSFIDRYKSQFEEIGLSFFEMTVGMAFKYFEEQSVDIVVLETGMGGRLDSTNVVVPELSVITNIGLDHTQFLGDTLEKVAGEKAGIIKKGVPVVIGQTQEEIVSVFMNKATEVSTDIVFADQLYSVMSVHDSKEYVRYDIEIENELVSFDLPLRGGYQKYNFVTALTSLFKLKAKGWDLSIEHIVSGVRNTVRNTGLIGRWQTLSKDPLVICDTGHNVDGIDMIVKQLGETEFKKLHFVLGMVNDKKIDVVLAMLPKNAEYYFCKADIPRGLDVELLKEQAGEHDLSGQVYASVNDAYEAARLNYQHGDLIFVGGSTFTVAEVV
jgi:dihydrofolate synthase/folylpolyglutamate synthase